MFLKCILVCVLGPLIANTVNAKDHAAWRDDSPIVERTATASKEGSISLQFLMLSKNNYAAWVDWLEQPDKLFIYGIHLYTCPEKVHLLFG